MQFHAQMGQGQRTQKFGVHTRQRAGRKGNAKRRQGTRRAGQRGNRHAFGAGRGARAASFHAQRHCLPPARPVFRVKRKREGKRRAVYLERSVRPVALVFAFKCFARQSQHGRDAGRRPPFHAAQIEKRLVGADLRRKVGAFGRAVRVRQNALLPRALFNRVQNAQPDPIGAKRGKGRAVKRERQHAVRRARNFAHGPHLNALPVIVHALGHNAEAVAVRCHVFAHNRTRYIVPVGVAHGGVHGADNLHAAAAHKPHGPAFVQQAAVSPLQGNRVTCHGPVMSRT